MTLPQPEIHILPGLSDYQNTLAKMEALAASIADGPAAEQIWLLEHPPLYTAGTSAVEAELLHPRFPVFKAGRGGRYTYHGPGQRVGYVMLNLNQRGKDVRQFVHSLEGWIIDALDDLGVRSWRADGRVGIWTQAHGQEAKIGAIGVRVRKWVTFHGFSVNISPDLGHFSGIVPCGLPEFAVTSFADLGLSATMQDLDQALMCRFSAFLDRLQCNNGFDAP
jgi:lipoyl(octanoyl) transferase